MSLDYKTVVKEFNRIKENEIKNFNNNVKNLEKLFNEHPERKEDFEIVVNTDDELEIFYDKWGYHWIIGEFELH